MVRSIKPIALVLLFTTLVFTAIYANNLHESSRTEKANVSAFLSAVDSRAEVFYECSFGFNDCIICRNTPYDLCKRVHSIRLKAWYEDDAEFLPRFAHLREIDISGSVITDGLLSSLTQTTRLEKVAFVKLFILNARRKSIKSIRRANTSELLEFTELIKSVRNDISVNNK